MKHCRNMILIILSSLSFPIASEPSTRGNGYLFIQRGTIPLVISIPHGGSTRIAGMPRRRNGTTLRDSGTLELGKRTSELIIQTGTGRPWIVGARFRRWYADPNRRPGQKAWENPTGRYLYRTYHRTLKEMIIQASLKGKPVLLIDLHGQSSKPADIYLGTAFNRSVESWRRRFGWDPAYGTNSKDPSAKGLRELLQSAGLNVPGEDIRKFSGGYITRHYMLRPDTAAVQIEVQRRWRLNPANREKMAVILSSSLTRMMQMRTTKR